MPQRNPYELLFSLCRPPFYLLMLLVGMCGVVFGVVSLGVGLAAWLGKGELVGHGGGPLMLLYMAILGIGCGTVFVSFAARQLRRSGGDTAD